MKTFVILGIVLLVACFVGAKMVMDQSSANSAKNKAAAESNTPPDRILCLGHFDVENGVAGLYPKQFGDIVKLAAENAMVEKGDVLLQIDDKLARIKIQQAEAAVKAAEQQLAEAKQLPELHKLQAEQQQAAIKAVESEIEKTKLDKKIKLKGLVDAELIKNSEAFYQFALDQLAEKKKAEESKLKQIQLQNATLKIDLAEADLSAKKAQVSEVKEMLNHFKIVAPSAGTVLRIYVHKGETLGPNPRYHAIDFLPEAEIIVRAEVLQEWGRLIKDPAEPGAKAQEVEIADDTYKGTTWKGTVKSISKWYAPTRSPVIEPFRYNDVRTLECIISVKEGDATKRIGQRVRAMVKLQ